MEKLDPLYRQLLQYGLMNLREAIRARDLDWAEAEAELLHNVPSLIGETNPVRHAYFWEAERQAYVDWLEQAASQGVRSRSQTFYQPIFDQLAQLQAELVTQRS